MPNGLRVGWRCYDVGISAWQQQQQQCDANVLVYAPLVDKESVLRESLSQLALHIASTLLQICCRLKACELIVMTFGLRKSNLLGITPPSLIRTKFGKYAQISRQWAITFRKFGVRSARVGGGKIRDSDEFRAAGFFCPQNQTQFCQLSDGRFSPNLATICESMSLRNISQWISEKFPFRVICPKHTSKLKGVKQILYSDGPQATAQGRTAERTLFTPGCSPKAREFSHSWSVFKRSLYFSTRGAYWDRLCRDVVGNLVVGRWSLVGWLVVIRVHCGQTVHPRPIVTMPWNTNRKPYPRNSMVQISTPWGDP